MESPGTDYLAAPLGKYLDRLAAAEPVPGGGSVAALAAALAAGLLSMTAGFTAGRPRFAAVDARMREILASAEEYRARGAAMVEADSAVYLEYRAAVALGRDDPERPAARRRALEKGNSLLLEIVALAREIVSLAGPLLEEGNPRLASDVACALHLARAAAGCAGASILANLSGLDAATAGEAGKRLASLEAEIDREARLLLQRFARGA